MRIVLDIPILYMAEVRRIAAERDTSPSAVVSGIVQLYLDSCAQKTVAKPLPAPNKRVIQDQNGTQYPSVKVASEQLNLHERLIYYVLNGEREQTGGYRFTYV